MINSFNITKGFLFGQWFNPFGCYSPRETNMPIKRLMMKIIVKKLPTYKTDAKDYPLKKMPTDLLFIVLYIECGVGASDSWVCSTIHNWQQIINHQNTI